MTVVTNALIVGETNNGKYMADRFTLGFHDRHNDLQLAFNDTPLDQGPKKFETGFSLRSYQRHVINAFNVYMHCMDDDDLVDQLANGKEEPDVHDIIEIITEFSEANPTYDILSVIPIDFDGTMAFVIKPIAQPKDMNP